jgi:hypothetical protein
MSEFDFSADWDADGLAEYDDDSQFGAGNEHMTALANDLSFADLVDGPVYEVDLTEPTGGLELYDSYGDGASYDLVGADPDEEGLWDQLVLDMNYDVNPYVAN